MNTYTDDELEAFWVNVGERDYIRQEQCRVSFWHGVWSASGVWVAFLFVAWLLWMAI